MDWVWLFIVNPLNAPVFFFDTKNSKALEACTLFLLFKTYFKYHLLASIKQFSLHYLWSELNERCRFLSRSHHLEVANNLRIDSWTTRLLLSGEIRRKRCI